MEVEEEKAGGGGRGIERKLEAQEEEAGAEGDNAVFGPVENAI